MSDKYRLATNADAEMMLEVISQAYESIRELGIAFRAASADLDMISENIINSSCYVLEIDGSIVATISLKNLEEVTDLPFLYWFAVLPSYKNQGVGNRLLTYVEEVVVRDTLLAPGVVLATSRNHPWLLAMYERKGYEPFHEKPLGEADTLIFLKKTLIKHTQLVQ
ncbi:GNAT family N-acetyltransferase [Paenibacillus sp. SYP-B3998]|uniref:GNAT family N-acetyltransferase n=1 Tax=Paenibacillus sp. SYP-B3998 TaxID=2678564 RepID=A0A6G3ZSA8_9BACL|nr:GNAT family N-acetyltransferase [Paenibacillus sp. SYP-B3998]NEW05096.1 GNAT family N-acetyltransferase [Paenibacillus sp. SYP-B3998]